MSDNTHYPGLELDVFQHATNWKKYQSRHIIPFLGNTVLEVGAGIGGTTDYLQHDNVTQWCCMEPDAQLAKRITDRLESKQLPSHTSALIGDLTALKHNQTFDSILYMDVLEHIKDDQAELKRAAKHLAPGGTLIVLCPAHQWLYSEFDMAIGHFRRYTKKSLKTAFPDSLSMEKCIYLDSIGLFASSANKAFLKSSTPTASQIKLWDKGILPISRVIDPLLAYSIGKSVLCIARAPR
ncbi:MAG: class I SAM-dependent methyltransferase [Pseudodesulfovibrio sp.]